MARATQFEENFAHYQLIGPIGRGGMASVFRARTGEGPEVALKVLAPERSGDPGAVRRFRQEFELLEPLRHKNLVQLTELVKQRKQLAIAMELVDGPSLQALWRDQKGLLDPGIACFIGAEIAGALAYIHKRSIFHRDLKPGNVLIDRKGVVKLSDFGVAHVEGTRLTRSGFIVGSPAYMAPEQLAGVRSTDQTTAVDTYALGVLLYKLVEGKGPFRLKPRQDLLEVLRIKREKTPLPFKKCDAPELEELVLGLLVPDPAERPADAAALGKQLSRLARRYKGSQRALRALVSDWPAPGSSNRRGSAQSVRQGRSAQKPTGTQLGPEDRPTELLERDPDDVATQLKETPARADAPDQIGARSRPRRTSPKAIGRRELAETGDTAERLQPRTATRLATGALLIAGGISLICGIAFGEPFIWLRVLTGRSGARDTTAETSPTPSPTSSSGPAASSTRPRPDATPRPTTAPPESSPRATPTPWRRGETAPPADQRDDVREPDQMQP